MLTISGRVQRYCRVAGRESGKYGGNKVLQAVVGRWSLAVGLSPRTSQERPLLEMRPLADDRRPRVVLEIFHERISEIRAVIVGDACDLTFHFFHQPVEVVP